MKYLSRQLALVLMLSGVGAAAPAYAEDFKRGLHSTPTVCSAKPSSAKAAQAKLEQEFSRRDKEINDLGNTLKTATEKFERDAPTLSDSQRQTRQKQLVDQDREFQRKRREFQEDLNARKNEELNQLGERINRSSSNWPSRKSTTSSWTAGGVHQPAARHHRQGDQGPQWCIQVRSA
jgi:outer membrane protein